MATRRVNQSKVQSARTPPATTPEGRENQLIAKAVDLVEKQLEEGTASAQVITHYLKLGSSREKLEQQRLSMEVDFMEAKKEQLASAQRVEELYSKAMSAFRGYSGQDDSEEQEGFDD